MHTKAARLAELGRQLMNIIGYKWAEDDELTPDEFKRFSERPKQRNKLRERVQGVGAMKNGGFVELGVWGAQKERSGKLCDMVRIGDELKCFGAIDGRRRKRIEPGETVSSMRTLGGMRTLLLPAVAEPLQ